MPVRRYEEQAGLAGQRLRHLRVTLSLAQEVGPLLGRGQVLLGALPPQQTRLRAGFAADALVAGLEHHKLGIARQLLNLLKPAAQFDVITQMPVADDHQAASGAKRFVALLE